jgi:hypothetical protein
MLFRLLEGTFSYFDFSRWRLKGKGFNGRASASAEKSSDDVGWPYVGLGDEERSSSREGRPM